MITIRRKRGDTLRLRFHTEFPLDGVAIASTVRQPLVQGWSQDLAVVPVDLPNRLFELQAPGPTDAWPVGRLAADIRYSRAGQVIRTETFFIEMRERMTP